MTHCASSARAARDEMFGLAACILETERVCGRLNLKSESDRRSNLHTKSASDIRKRTEARTQSLTSLPYHHPHSRPPTHPPLPPPNQRSSRQARLQSTATLLCLPQLTFSHPFSFLRWSHYSSPLLRFLALPPVSSHSQFLRKLFSCMALCSLTKLTSFLGVARPGSNILFVAGVPWP